MKRFSFIILAAVFGLCSAAVLFCSALAGAQIGTSAPGKTTGPQATPTPAKPVATPPKIKEEEEIYKVDTELVNLNVRVIDRFNRPIGNVQQGDFKIFEDNVPQSIEFFSKSEVPTNYSLVIDNSGSLRSQIDKVIEASKILIATNKPEDETNVIRFISSEKIEILQDFTSNKTDLNDALDNMYIDGGQTAIIDAVYLAAEKVTEYEKASHNVDRKRRALVLVTDGEDRNSFYNEKQLFDFLRENDVQIYVVGFVNDLSKEGGFIRKSDQGKAKALLNKLATETGGRSFYPNAVSELNGIAREIAGELRSQYSIGYIPTNDRNDGTYRNIKVMINDGPSSQKRIAITRAGRTADSDSAVPIARPTASPLKNQ